MRVLQCFFVSFSISRYPRRVGSLPSPFFYDLDTADDDKPVSPANNAHTRKHARAHAQYKQGPDVTGLAYRKELPQMDDYSGKQLQLSTGVAT